MKLSLIDIQKIVSISQGNLKLAFIPSVSQPRVVSCNKHAPCVVSGCYSAKEKRFPAVIQARMKNYKSYKKNPDLFFYAISTWIKNVVPSYFRWHVTGDIVDKRYFEFMVNLALKNDKTNFLAYTKKYELLPETVPKNLSIFVSAWPNFKFKNPYKYPVAWMQDGSETRIPGNVYVCQSTCFECKFCWHPDRDVVFEKH